MSLLLPIDVADSVEVQMDGSMARKFRTSWPMGFSHFRVSDATTDAGCSDTDATKRSRHCRSISEASTDAGCSDAGTPVSGVMSYQDGIFELPPLLEEAQTCPSSGQQEAAKDETFSFNFNSSDVGGLLLQSFELRDENLRLHEGYMALEQASRDCVSNLREELKVAHDQMAVLQAQLETQQEERCIDFFRMQDTKSELEELRGRASASPQVSIERVLQITSRRITPSAKAACFKAWRKHVAGTKVQRLQREISIGMIERVGQCHLAHCCLSRWACHVRSQQQRRNELRMRLLNVTDVSDTAKVAHHVTSQCWHAWSRLALSRATGLDIMQQAAASVGVRSCVNPVVSAQAVAPRMLAQSTLQSTQRARAMTSHN